jgi:hypothetical protein
VVEKIAVALFIAVFGLISKIIQQNMEKKSRINVSGKLQHHYIFSHIDDLISRIDNEVNIEDEGREILVKIVVKEKILIFKKNLMELSIKLDNCYENCDKDNVNGCNRLYEEHMKTFNKSMTEFNNFYKNNDYLNDKEGEVLKIFMDSFAEYNQMNINGLRDFVFRVCNSKLFTDCKYITSSIYNLYITIFDKMILDAEKTLSSLNGDLTGKIINGVEIGEMRDIEDLTE